MGLRGPKGRAVRKQAPSEEPVSTGPKTWRDTSLSRADRVIAFIEEELVITQGKGAGTPFILREWQKAWVRLLFGTRDGKRVVREALITVARKNGKTEFAAAVAMAMLCGPEAELRGEAYSAAADRDQAARIFRSMEAFINANPELWQRINIKRFEKTLEVLDGEGAGSIYRALSSDATKAHGLSVSFAVADELAQWKGRELFDNLRTGVGAREEPLLLIISTKSPDPHSVMSEVTDYGMRVNAGEVDDETFAAIIYDAPLDDDAWDEETWLKANPALGDFRSIEEMRTAAKMAQRIPARETAFRNLYLNQAVEQDERFIPAAEWQACQGIVDPDALRGRPCWGGLDLSSTTDLTSLGLYFPYDGGVILPFFWVPADRLKEREDTDRVPYKQWAADGLLEAPPGRAIDRLAIARRLAQVASMYDLRGLAFDRWRIEDLLKLLSDEGLELPLEPWGQGYRDMEPAVSAFEAAVLDRRLVHGGHPILTWNVGNAVVTSDPAGSRKIDKSKSREKVDGLIAVVMAMGLYARQPPEMTRQVFHEHDIAAMLSDEVQPLEVA